MFRAATLLILATAAYWTLRLAWADHLSRRPDLTAPEGASRLVPWSAPIHERLAEKQDETGADPIPSLARAAALDPSNPRRFERLGQRAELAGDFALAEASLLRAATVSRLYQPRYLLAQYYFRRRNAAQWDYWSRRAFDAAPGSITSLLELASRMTPDPAVLARQGIDTQPASARQILFYLVKNGHAAAAAPLARHLAQTGGPADVPALLGFCEQSLADAAVSIATEIWNILCGRRLLPYSPLDPKSPVTNPDFGAKPLGIAFDWHVEPIFTWQYVPLRSGASYRVVPEDVASSELKLFFPTSSGWREFPTSTTFRAPYDLARLALRGNARGIRLELVP